MKYTKLYRDQLEMFKSTTKGKQALRNMFGRKPVSFPRFVKTIKTLSSQSVDGKPLQRTLSEELQWRSLGSPVIFLENEALVKCLHSSQFNYEKDFAVVPPFKSFSMSFPEKTVINGVELKSALVSIMTRKEFMDLYGPLVITLGDINSTEYGYDELCISIQFENGFGVIDSNFAHISNLSAVLNNNALTPLKNQGTEALDALVKIALALCVYHSATDGEKLKKGYPSSTIVFPKGKTKVNYQAITAQYSKTRLQVSEGLKGRKVTHRVPHFRNLRAERFYKKDEHKHLKRGSRWTFVRGVDVNDSVNTLIL
ncbi:TPA: hypothetical protein ACGF4T_002106 [Vibrio cholerae]